MSLTRSINLNADMAESADASRIGNDYALLTIVRSANIACGFHAGDPVTMQAVTRRAAQEGVSIGAHPGFEDAEGFGRRRIEMRTADLECMVAYQIGALRAIAAYAGSCVTHVKAHGALYNMAAARADYAQAIGRAIRTVDRSLIFVVFPESEMETAGRELGLAVAREGFCDRWYDDDGLLSPRGNPDAVITDPAVAAQQAVRLALDGEAVSRTGKVVRHRVETLCIHGDEPNAVPVARACRAALEAAGLTIVPLTEMTLA